MKIATRLIFPCLIVTFFAFVVPAEAKVWQATNNWSLDWEKKFSNWMTSQKVNTTIFTSRNSPYFGIKADCADASYALRAIFSLENSLPFTVKNPSGARSGYATLNNDTSKFDKAGPANKRLVALINYLGDAVGTEHLNYHDTVPVKIESIAPGMLFTYKINGRLGKSIRHSYNIKDVTPTGDFDVIYATQAIAKKGLPLNFREGFAFSNAPQTVWGFKRFKWPTLINESVSSYPEEFGYSQEQFQLSESLGARGFFRYVKKVLQVNDQSAEQLLRSKLNTLCRAANDRIESVNQGVEHHRQTGGRCMNYADFDAYSTPSRDKSLLNDFENLFYEMKDLEQTGLVGEVDYAFWDSLKEIRSGLRQGQDSALDRELLGLCSINYKRGATIHLGELFRRIDQNLLSSHPNDELAQRWGETARNRTRCKAWY
ncbi:MAG: hypothetical protein K9K67_15100 [Bacteriovoracaceae bacterium]|nr:hypothetical protein [Bacteriovoracaceae bacterium]